MNLDAYCAICIRRITDEGKNFKDEMPNRAVTLNGGTPVCLDHNEPTNVQVLKVKPGETLAISLGFTATPEVMERVTEALKQQLPAGVGFIFVDQKASLSVVKTEGAA